MYYSTDWDTKNKKNRKEVNTMVKQILEKEMTGRQQELEDLEDFVVEGDTFISDEVLAQIAGQAAREIDGVSAMGKSSLSRSISKVVKRGESRATGVDAAHGKKEAQVDLAFNVLYGYSIPQIVIEVRKNVAQRLLDSCGLVTRRVQIEIIGIEFPDKMPSKLD